MPDGGNHLNRREYIKAFGAATAGVTLAGCSGGDSPPTTSGTGTTGTTGTGTDGSTGTTAASGEPMDTYFTTNMGVKQPRKIQFNPYNAKLLFGEYKHFDKMVTYDKVNREFHPRVVSEWSVDEETMTLTVNDEYTWVKRESNEWVEAEPVTAEDLVLHFWVKTFNEDPAMELFDSWTAKDERTVELKRSDGNLNNEILKQRVLPERVYTPRAVWSDAVTQLRDAEGDEFDQLMNDKLLNAKHGIDQVRFNGAFLYDETRAKRRIIMTKNPFHPNADTIEIPYFDLIKTGKRQQTIRAAFENEIDYTGTPMPSKVSDQLSDHWQPVYTEGLTGGATWFDHRHEWFGKREVRQAVRLAVDNRTVVRNQNRTPVSSVITGIANQRIRENWVGDMMGDLTDYKGKQFDKAAELMREAGAEKNEDGLWADSSGNPIEAPVKAISNWTGAITMGKTIASHLNEFGIKSEIVGIESNTFFQEHWTDKGMKPFTLIKFPVFGVFNIWHPYNYWATYFTGPASEKVGSGHKYKVPATIGDPDSSLETVDAPALTEEIARTEDEARQREITRRLVWLYNQNPVTFLNNKPGGELRYSTDHWNVPEVEDPRQPPAAFENNSPIGLMEEGLLTPKRKSQ